MPDFDFIIAGGGASGLMTAYRMSMDKHFDNKSIAIIDRSPKDCNDRTWCFWETPGGEWDHLVEKTWDKAYFGSPLFSKSLNLSPLQYKMIRSAGFYTFLTGRIKRKPNFSFIFSHIKEINEEADVVKIKTKEGELTASKVLSSLLNTDILTRQNKHPYLKQHFTGWFVQTQYPVFDPDTVTFMDFNIPQSGSTRFMYLLPAAPDKALLEYTLFSAELLKEEEYEAGIKTYLSDLKPGKYEIIEKESGNIPMTSFPFHKRNTKNLLHIGTAGGWTKASTGYTFYNCSEKSKSLVSFLKTGRELDRFYRSGRFQWYDNVFLSVLSHKNHLGAEIFANIFKKTDAVSVFKFLCEESGLWEEMAIMNAVPKREFLWGAVRSMIK